MAKIVGFEDMQSIPQLQQELQQGAKFVMYQYCISLFVVTFKRWGLPWGPIYTLQTLWINLRGGKDITKEIAASMAKTG
jgi:hypothetical protein